MTLNHRQFQYGWIYCLAILCLGCTKDLDIDLKPFPSQLVVKGTLSPQHGLLIQVFQTLDPYIWNYRDSNAHFVENAVAEIYHNDTLIDQCRYLKSSYYQSIFPEKIVGGQEYSIKVSAPGFDQVYVRSIRIPEAPPIIRDFKIKPYDEQPLHNHIENLLTFSVANQSDYVVYHIKETYDENPEEVLGFYLLKDVNEACEDFDRLFSNKCYDEEWIEKQYHMNWHYEDYYDNGLSYPFPQQWINFHIGIIDPLFVEYNAADNGGLGVESGYTEPALSKGNVEGGLGYVLGENIVTKRYKIP